MVQLTSAAPPIVIIQPSRGWRALDLRELWRFRELVYFLALRDVKVRYKQTALGVAWVLLQPLLAMGIFSIVFGQRGLTTSGVPYPLFVVSALVPWFYFSNATSGASGSVVGNTQLISKVYFPRLAIPLAAASWFAPQKPGAESGNYFLFVGTLEPRKNLAGLVDAWRQVRRRYAAPRREGRRG